MDKYQSDGSDEAVEGGEYVKDAILPERWFVNVVPPIGSNHRRCHVHQSNTLLSLFFFPFFSISEIY